MLTQRSRVENRCPTASIRIRDNWNEYNCLETVIVPYCFVISSLFVLKPANSFNCFLFRFYDCSLQITPITSWASSSSLVKFTSHIFNLRAKKGVQLADNFCDMVEIILGCKNTNLFTIHLKWLLFRLMGANNGNNVNSIVFSCFLEFSG